MSSSLILAPHPDDEVLWCFSALGNESRTVVFTYNERAATSEIIAGITGTDLVCCGFEDTLLPEYGHDLIEVIEKEITRKQYDTVFIPARSEHQDHQAVHDAAMTALRPGMGVKARVLEYPYVDHGSFTTNLYRWLSPEKMREKQIMLAKFQGKNLGYWTDSVLCWNTALAARFTLQGGLQLVRTSETERIAETILKEKWGEHLILHAKKPHLTKAESVRFAFTRKNERANIR
jgi:hypothetical protein